MNREIRIGTAEILLSVFILSFSGPFIRWAAIPSAAMAFVRVSIPSLILGLYLLVRHGRGGPVRRLSGRTRAWLLAVSGLNAFRVWLFFEAYRLTTMGNAVIVLYSWPMFALVFGFFILGEQVRRRDIVFLLLAFTGMVIVYSGGVFSLRNRDFLGMTLMLISAIIYALILVLIRRENVERLQATFWQNLVGSVVFLPMFLRHLDVFSVRSTLFALANGLLVGTLGFVLFFSAIRRLPSAVFGHVSYLEAVFTVIWGAWLFAEPVSWRHITGGGLIVTTMVVRAELARRAAAVISPLKAR